MPLRAPRPRPIPPAPPRIRPCLVPRFHSQEFGKSNWCWAACVQMMLEIDQFDLASKLFDTDCRAASTDSVCDVTLQDDQITNLYESRAPVRPTYTPSQVILDVIRQELAHTRPVQLGVGRGGSRRGHVVLVCGLDDPHSDNPEVTICDPAFVGRSSMKWSALQRAYQAGVVWDATWTNLRR